MTEYSISDALTIGYHDLAYEGSLSDMQRQYLLAFADNYDLTFSGSLADMQRAYLLAFADSQDIVLPAHSSLNDLFIQCSMPIIGIIDPEELVPPEPPYVSPWPDPFPSVTVMNFTGSTTGQPPTLSGGWSVEGTNTDFVTEAGPLVTYGDATTEGKNIKLVAGGTSYRRLIFTQTASAGPRMVGFYFKLNETPNVSLYLTRLLVTNVTNRCDWRVNTDRTVSLRNAGSVSATSGISLNVNQAYWAEWLVNGATQTLRIYEPDGVDPIITLTSACPNTLADTVLVGHMANFNGLTTFFDRVTLHTDWIRL